MCIIAASPKGNPQPSEKAMRNMWDSNPHGAGYMFARNGQVVIHKGFMDYEAFIKSVEAENFTEDDPVVYHFRIATQGGINPSMTHPFPLATDTDAMRWLDLTCACGIAHNGIIPQYSTAACKSTGFSDTALFITDCMSKIVRSHEDLCDPETIRQLKDLCKSKLAILDRTGDLFTVGDFTSDHGILYSNTTYKPFRFSFRGYTRVSKSVPYDDRFGDDDLYWA